DQFVDSTFVAADQSKEKTNLGRWGFQYAVETNWVATDSTQARVFLLQFDNSDGARHYIDSATLGTSKPNKPLAELSLVPDGWALADTDLDEIGDIHQIGWVAVGNIVVELNYFTPAAPNRPGLEKLIKAQYTRLKQHITNPSP